MSDSLGPLAAFIKPVDVHVEPPLDPIAVPDTGHATGEQQNAGEPGAADRPPESEEASHPNEPAALSYASPAGDDLADLFGGFAPGTGATVVDPPEVITGHEQVTSPTTGDEHTRVPVDRGAGTGVPHHGAHDDFPWMQNQSYADRLGVHVEKLRAIIADDPRLSTFAAGLLLTRDGVIDREQRRQLAKVLSPTLIDSGMHMSVSDNEVMLDLVYDDLIGLGPLGPLWRDDRVTEICVDSWERITVQVAGRWVITPLRFRSLSHAQTVARSLALKVSDRALSKSIPLVTAVLPGGRVQFAYDPVSDSRLTFVIRKFKPLMGMDGLLAAGALNQEAADFLAACVIARSNVLVSGTTNSGKTTAINALSESIPVSERVICIEDARELHLSSEHVVYLQTKERSSVDDTVSVTQADLLRAVLRMSPDRILVGEIREPEGAVTMLDAATTGHDGTMTTIHAGSAAEAVNQRMANLVRKAAGGSLPDEVAKADVASAFDLVLQLTFEDGRRFVHSIAAVDTTQLVNGVIHPEIIFSGAVVNGVPSISRVGQVRADTSLGRKLTAAGYASLL